MSVILSQNNYGKSGVRVLKVTKNSSVHEIKEMNVNVQLEGDFDKVHTEGDNRKVLPTDTMKNTVYVLAKEHPVKSIEEFGIYLAKYFIENNKQVSGVKIYIEEKLWDRISVTGENNSAAVPHPHSFISRGDEKRICSIIHNKNIVSVSSGILGLLVLKTTESGFEHYIKDKYTTLKETNDRVFSTSVKAVWSYANQEVNYARVTETVRQIILDTFAKHHSLSVQQTLYETGKSVLDICTDISEISASMPNKHYLLFNLGQFGIENKNEIFIPTDEPFGLIEAKLKRDK
ncbi:MAG: urate oxidase [Ignavibacteria bacterium]|nr:urate oxidase [Ignavibacteria bacterium]